MTKTGKECSTVFTYIFLLGNHQLWINRFFWYFWTHWWLFPPLGALQPWQCFLSIGLPSWCPGRLCWSYSLGTRECHLPPSQGAGEPLALHILLVFFRSSSFLISQLSAAFRTWLVGFLMVANQSKIIQAREQRTEVGSLTESWRLLIKTCGVFKISWFYLVNMCKLQQGNQAIWTPLQTSDLLDPLIE